jgi:hypothetical protein
MPPGAPPEAARAAARAAARVTRRPSWPAALLAVGLAVQLAPVLLLPMVLTQDGPAHVDGAWILLHHGDDDAVGAALRSSYAIDLSPVPNMLTTLLLALLLRVLSPDAAEKAVVAGFVVLLVAGVAYALRGVDRRAGWLCVAALPLAGGQLVAYGFYNFCWGVALALFVLGVALRRREGWTPWATGAAALLLVLTWSAHLLPWVMAVTVVGGLATGRWVAAVRTGARPWGAAARHLLPPLAAVLPGGALTVGYLVEGRGQHGAAAGWGDVARVGELLTLYRPLVVGSWWEIVPAIAVAVVLAGLVVVAVRRRPPGSTRPATGDLITPTAGADRVVLGISTVVAAAAFLLTPARLGPEYGFLPERLAWFPPLLLVLFCATRPPGRRAWQRVAAGVLVLAATAAALVRLPTQLADQREAAELLSVAAVLPEGTTFAVLRFAGHEAALAPLAGEPDPLRHLSSRLAVEVGGVDVGHYEAVYPYFQVRFLPGSVREVVDPGLDGLDEVPPWVHLGAAGDRLQYVVVVGLDRAEDWVRSAHRTAGVLADLRAHYAQVTESTPTCECSVWRLRADTQG